MNELYKQEALLIDTFFVSRRPKSLEYSIARRNNVRLVRLNPKYACYPIDVPIGVSLRDLKNSQADLARVIHAHRAKHGFRQEVRVMIQEQPAQVVVARVNPVNILYSDRPSNIKPRMMLVGKSFIGGKVEQEIINLNHPDTCHVLVAGKTGCGKTRMMYQMVLSACEASEPSDFQVAIIDIGGKAFDGFTRIPHCSAYVTELDEAMALLRHFETKLVGKQDTYQTRTLIVVDEMPALTSTGDKDQSNEFARLLKVLAERGRAYGISLLLGAQNPTDQSVPVSVRRNLGVRVAGMCSEQAMSEIILDKGNQEAASLSLQGTFIVKHSGRSRLTFSYYMDDECLVNEIARIETMYDKCAQVELLLDGEDDLLPPQAVEAAMNVLKAFDDGKGELRNGYIMQTKQAIAEALGRKAFTGNVAPMFDKFIDYVVGIYKSNNYML